MTEDFTQMSSHTAVLRRRGWIIVVAMLLGAVLGGLTAPLATSSYSADAVVLVPTRENSSDPALVETQAQVVISDRVVQEVVGELGGGADAGDLLDSTTVEVVPDTTALSITSAQGAPDEAARVANAFADSYVRVYAESQEEQRLAAAEALQNELNATSGRLVDLQQDLPGLTGGDLVEAEAAVDRQRQRQTRLVAQLATVQDPTSSLRTASVLQDAVAPAGGGAGRLRTAFFGLVLGFLIGLGIAYARHYSDDRIRDEDGLAALVGRIPVLGRIPKTGKGRGGGGVLGDPGSKTAEAYRALAVNLRLRVEHPRATASAAPEGAPDAAADAQGTGVMALIISASPGEGKSTVAGDLALTAARMGLRVALVDADLRNPQLATRFGAPAAPGLTDALGGSGQMPRPVEVGVDNLRLLPAGVMHADPATLLSRANVTDVWDTLRAENDLVVVDTAPVLYAAETAELATVADRVVMVVERGRTTQRDLRNVVERLGLVDARPTGVVLTKVPARDVVGGYYPR